MKTLKMQFTLDDEKVLTMSLPNPRVDLNADDVRSFMNSCVAKDVIDYNGARLAAAKAAYIVEVVDEVLF